MPAYRSAAEAEVRDAVISALRILRPSARIIHEINAGTWGPNRIDVLAVDRSEIIAVEVKSAKDKLDRLPDQIKSMSAVAQHVIAALHEKHLVSIDNPKCPDIKKAPKQARGAVVWCYPEAGTERGRSYGVAQWEKPAFMPKNCLPPGSLNFLWRDELFRACKDLGVAAKSTTTRPSMMNAINWNCTGQQISWAICAALRRRPCVEADPSVESDIPFCPEWR